MDRANPSQSGLKRRLGTADAVVLGLGSMLGAGVFAAFAPAARAAGGALLISLAIAALVAFCNATSSAQLAAVYPESGGAYVYGRERLSPFWGFLAGWGFVFGKTASCAAMAMTFGGYVAPTLARPLALGAVVCLTAVNYFGIQKTAALTRVIVSCVLLSLLVVVAAVWGGGAADISSAINFRGVSIGGVLEAAGFLFFAFAGYARIATLGEEVKDPRRVIPRAIPIALGITCLVYAVVGFSILSAAGAPALASSEAPLATAVGRGSLSWLSPAVRVGAAIGCLGVLLSLIVGISRTLFAMAKHHDVPSFLRAVHPRYAVPHRAELLVGGLVATLVCLADVRGAIGFSSFCVLTYYAITNAAAWKLGPGDRRSWRGLPLLGGAGCGTLALTLPSQSVSAGLAVLGVGATLYWLRRAAG